MKKILIINPFGIGDVIFSTVLIDILKHNFPQSKLFYICNKRTREILEACPDLEKVFVFEKQEYRNLWKESKMRCVRKFLSFLFEIKKEKIDLAIDLSMGYHYSFFLMLLGVPNRVGFNYKKRGMFLTRKLNFEGFDTKPIAEYYLDLARIIGLKVEYPVTTKIWVTKADEDRVASFLGTIRANADLIFGIAPGGGVSFGNEKIKFKRWDLENFARLADKLIENLNSEIIFIWGPGEKQLIENISSLMRNKPRIAPPTTINQMAALMKKCDTVICNDGGPLHVAVAAGAKTISIFGPSDEKVYGPYPYSPKHLIITNCIDCRPCYKKFRLPNCQGRLCLTNLNVSNVFAAVKCHIGNIRRENVNA